MRSRRSRRVRWQIELLYRELAIVNPSESRPRTLSHPLDVRSGEPALDARGSERAVPPRTRVVLCGMSENDNVFGEGEIFNSLSFVGVQRARSLSYRVDPSVRFERAERERTD